MQHLLRRTTNSFTIPSTPFLALFAVSLLFCFSKSLASTSQNLFSAARDAWDDTTFAGVQLPHKILWSRVQFSTFLDFLFPEVIANYTVLSPSSKNITFPSGQWIHIDLVETNHLYNYILYRVEGASPNAIIPALHFSSLLFFVQVYPWIGKEKEVSILKSGYKLQTSITDPTVLRQAHATLASIIRTTHDTARTQLGAYPCSNEFRTYAGTCNNPQHHHWGSAFKPLKRVGNGSQDPAYIPGTNDYPAHNMPSPRLVSRTLFQQHSSLPSSRKVTTLAVFFGQFIDHDIGLTPESAGTVFEEHMDIHINDTSDPLFHAHHGVLEFTRSRGVTDGTPCCGHGITERYPRDPINSQTSFIDASHVYGCQRDRVTSLRMWKFGQLQTGLLSTNGEHFMPLNRVDQVGTKLDNAGSDSDDFFVAGDARVNEQPVLVSFHTLFLREHNRVATLLNQTFSCWTDEKIFQYSRKIVAAQIQFLTYEFFIPAILGKKFGLSLYTGYNDTVDPTVTNFFSTSAFRFGHSMVTDTLKILDTINKANSHDEISLHEVFFSPSIVKEVGIEGFLLGASHQIAESVDTKVVNSLQNELFKGLTGGIDLIALNIQRGRDHGIPKYNDARHMYGLPRKVAFEHISSDTIVQKRLKDLYGTVNEIDSFVGGLAEDHQEDSELGELFHTAIRDQFERSRDGDRFFYEALEWPQEMSQIQPLVELVRKTLTLQKIIVRNSGNRLRLSDFPQNVFQKN